jgi:hypothetical protein
MGVAEIDPLLVLRDHITLERLLRRIAIGGDAQFARTNVTEERRTRSAQSGRLADGLPGCDDVVALGVADCWGGCGGAFEESRGGVGCCDSSLAGPVAGGDGGDGEAVDDFYDDVFGEDVIAQPECEGREGEVAGCERVVPCLSVFPLYQLRLGCIEAIERVADIAAGRRIGEDVTSEWMPWSADLTRWATPGVVIRLGLDVADCRGGNGAGGYAGADVGD